MYTDSPIFQYRQASVLGFCLVLKLNYLYVFLHSLFIYGYFYSIQQHSITLCHTDT